VRRDSRSRRTAFSHGVPTSPRPPGGTRRRTYMRSRPPARPTVWPSRLGTSSCRGCSAPGPTSHFFLADPGEWARWLLTDPPSPRFPLSSLAGCLRGRGATDAPVASPAGGSSPKPPGSVETASRSSLGCEIGEVRGSVSTSVGPPPIGAAAAALLFAGDGALLEGPATRDLERRHLPPRLMSPE
jgi:hypothetical protein